MFQHATSRLAVFFEACCVGLKTMPSVMLYDKSVLHFCCYFRATASGKIFDVSSLSVLGG